MQAAETREATLLDGRYWMDPSPVACGAMGAVHPAVKVQTGQAVIIKRLRPSKTGRRRHRERLLREAEALARVEHPNVVRILDRVEDEAGDPCLVLEHLDGETLADRLDREGVAPEEALRIALELALALRAVHAAGVVHRDVKPANVMLASDDRVKLIDFGIAKLAETRHPGPALTVAGCLMGSPAYMPPEQILGEAVSEKTDVYALGITLYQMLVGRTPFHADRNLDTLVMHIEAPPPALPPELELPAVVDALVQTCLAKSVAARPHLDAVIEALRSVLGTRVLRDRPATPSVDPSEAPTLVALPVV